METRHNIAITTPFWERLRKHCDKTGEKMYRAVERYIGDGIIKDHDDGKG